MGRHCDLCDHVYLATDAIAEQHDRGKRHLRNLANKTELDALARRSVFLFGFPPNSFSTEVDLAQPFSNAFGTVSRVILDSNKGTFAIVEFVDPSSAQNAIAAKSIQIASHKVLIKERKTDFEKKTAPVSEKPVVADVLAKLAEAGTDFEAQVDSLIHEVALSEEDLSNRQNIAEQLTEALADYLPSGARVEVFGSSATGLGTKGCDLDCTILFGGDGLVLAKAAEAGLLRSKFHLMTSDMSLLSGENKLTNEEMAKLTPADRVRYVSKALNDARKSKKAPISDQTPVLDAKCPVIRFFFDHHCAIELSIDNRLGVNNSKWLAALLRSDASGKLRRFLLVLRFWALSGGLFDAGKNHLNHYVLTLLAVAFLQNKGKISPVIHQSNASGVISGWNVGFSVDPRDFSDEKLSELLKEFFKFFAQTPFKDVVVCPRLGRLLSWEEFEAAFPDERIKNNFKHSLLNVQDPFELSHNTAANANEKCLSRLRRLLVVSIAKLKTPTPSLTTLCSADDDRPNNSSAKSTADLTVRVPLNCANATEAAAKAAVERLLVAVLKFEPRMEPGFKRKRVMREEDAQSEFDVEHRLWQGRRGKRREVERSHPEMTEFDAEVEVSRLLLLDEQRATHGTKLLAVRVDVDVESAGDRALDIHFHRIEGADIDFHNLSHFLDTFLKKLVPQLIGDNDAMEM
uniref:Speckle targeted PIP5K1A-regulated poly(A) polymerase n=1 Tax=Plectus sambesii TaxID=2011161 RepID=A0A914UWT5_9BILA